MIILHTVLLPDDAPPATPAPKTALGHATFRANKVHGINQSQVYILTNNKGLLVAILQARRRWLFLVRGGGNLGVEAVQTECGVMDSGGGGGIEHLVYRFRAHICAYQGSVSVKQIGNRV